ncbi:MAG: hypothetical protein ACTSPY_17540 [Candidatus Helarchaeota archaeon]
MSDEEKPCKAYCGENHKGTNVFGNCLLCGKSMCEICGVKDAGIHKQSVNVEDLAKPVERISIIFRKI